MAVTLVSAIIDKDGWPLFADNTETYVTALEENQPTHDRVLNAVTVRGTPSASDAHSSSASASDSRLPSASAPATSSLFRNAFGRMTSYATRSRPASAPDHMVSRDVA